MAKWLLVDGYNMAFRAFYGMPELTRTDGFPTGALHGWVKTMWRLQDQEKPDAMVVFFDLGGSQDRLALHPEYKAQRKETPEPLEKQIPVIKELTRAMGLVGVELDGVESDDLLAAQARLLAKDGHEVLIVSADKDFAQCVDGRIKILLPPPTANPKLGWRVLDPAGVVRPLEELYHAGHEVHVVHLIAPDEEAPEVGEDVELVDVETGELVSVSLTRDAVRDYRAAFAAHCAQVRAACARSGIGYAVARSDERFEDVVLGALREGTLLR